MHVNDLLYTKRLWRCWDGLSALLVDSLLNRPGLAHLSQFSLLTSRQHGFLPRCSTLTNLLVTEEFITKCLDEGSVVVLIYLDFTKGLGIVLNTRLSAEDNVVRAANKACRSLFYLKRSFAALTPSIFLPLYKTFIRPQLEYAIQATHPILCWDAEALEKVQKLALKFAKGLRQVPYEAALKQLRLFPITHRRIRGDLIAMFTITHCLLEFPMAPTFIYPTHQELRGHAFHQQRCCTSRRQFAFTIQAVLFWNNILHAHWQSLLPKVPI